MKLYISLAAALIAASCGQTAEDKTPEVETPELSQPAETGPATGTLEWAAGGDWRSDAEKARDAFRHPVETLEFFGIKPDSVVVEIWPGGGWYTQILAPYLKQGGGTLIAAGFDPARSEGARNAVERFAETYVSNPDRYGTVTVTVLSGESTEIAPAATADFVLTFRNIHNWMSGGYEATVFQQAYDALKPGGVLGVVEHRLPSAMTQDPGAASGYVHEDYVKALAEAAGFEFVAASEINANPADSADHPFGVWTLPPSSATADREGNTPEGFDPEPYKAIGESDRMTLKFVKPE